LGAPQTTWTGWPALGGEHAGDDERLQRRLVVDMLDLEADRGQLLDDLIEGGLGFEMILEPGEGEFHYFRSLKRREVTSEMRSIGSKFPICTMTSRA
jgi:hypothetical protein